MAVAAEKLSREAYKALEDVVGPEWISEDRAEVEAYSYELLVTNYAQKLMADPSVIPAAVIWPETTEQVQAIVRVCNRYKIPYTPSTNNQMLVVTEARELVIAFSRMDKILNIDTENMVMTCQAYVDYARLQAASMPYGLWNGGTPYAGSICKIASHVASAGIWFTDMKYGTLSRNVVSVRVVLPTGEVMDTGSRAMAGAADFFEYAPGPDLMALYRTTTGAYGIITEVTIKLWTWVGEPELPSEPEVYPSIPTYADPRTDRVRSPKRYADVFVVPPTKEALVDIHYKVSQSSIGEGMHSENAYFTNNTYCSLTREQSMKRVEEHFWPDLNVNLCLSGVASEEQLEYEKKVVEKIVSETPGAYIVSKENKPEVYDALVVWHLDVIRHATSFRVMRDGWQLTACIGWTGPTEWMIPFDNQWIEHFKPPVLPLDDHAFSPIVYSVRDWSFFEHDWGVFVTHTKSDLGALMNATMNMLSESARVGLSTGASYGPPTLGMMLLSLGTYNQSVRLQRKFKRLLDPNLLCSPKKGVWMEEDTGPLLGAVNEVVAEVRKEEGYPELPG